MDHNRGPGPLEPGHRRLVCGNKQIHSVTKRTLGKIHPQRQDGPSHSRRLARDPHHVWEVLHGIIDQSRACRPLQKSSHREQFEVTEEVAIGLLLHSFPIDVGQVAATSP